MQIEKENSNRIRITLRPVDLQQMNISVESLKPNSPQLHNFLYEIMERVREETGFNPYAGQIMVEALPMGEGMVLTVTRISAQKKTPPVNREKIRKVHAVINKNSARRTAFVFDEFDDFCEAVKALDKATLKNGAYYRLNEKNVLLVSGISLQERCILKEYAACAKGSTVMSAYLKEHGKLIASGDELVSMAEGIAGL